MTLNITCNVADYSKKFSSLCLTNGIVGVHFETSRHLAHALSQIVYMKLNTLQYAV